ncbi:MAG: OmpA family protein [Bacteroidota bacterium]|nr:OmpA family protein [Bacteroidota bacterium]
MRYLFSLTLIFGLTVFVVDAKAQSDNIDSLNIAEAYLESENFSNAIKFYQRFLMQMPDDPELNFKMGFSLLNTPNGKEESIEFFEKSTKLYRKKEGRKSTSYYESSFYLGRAYRSAYQFAEALDIFEKLHKKIKSRRIRKEIELEMELCRDGIQLTKNKLNIDLKSLGRRVNSKFSDHSPVISADESILIFTSRRKNNSGGEGDMDGRYDEDIFVTFKTDTGWSSPTGISPEINSSDHEASIGLTVDGQKLFIYKPEDNGSIYSSDLEGLTWGTPQKLGKNVNTRHRETHASLSADGRFLYFTSDRFGGLGGLDIYSCEMQDDGTWGKAKNLGDAVNTELDEEGPYIHPDGRTLYFCSEGHTNLGGFDIFTANRNQFGTFTKAKNLGYPINTVQDDIFYLPTADGKRAYYASKKRGGLGSNDIYLVEHKDNEGSGIAVMVGYVYTECTKEFPRADITVINEQTGQEWYYVPNSNSGKFVFVIEKGQEYSFVTRVDGEIVFSDKLKVGLNSMYQQEYKSIRLDPQKRCDEEVISVVDTVEQTITVLDQKGDTIPQDKVDITASGDTIIYDLLVSVENILFASNNDNFSGDKSTETISDYLKNNPTSVIEIGGYADAVGNAKYNNFLSFKRAHAVRKILLKNGVNYEQIKVKAYGEENPIAFNKTNGRFNYKSLRYNRRVEFRVLKQGKNTLKIKPISVLPTGYKNPDYQKDYKKAARNDIEIEI